jgi:hypothetical protein
VQQDFLLTASLWIEAALCAGAALVLSYLHWTQKQRQHDRLKAKPLDGILPDRPQPAGEKHLTQKIGQAGEQFSRLCESVKDLPPKEQASRVQEHFGIFRGARPANGRGRTDKRP